MAAVARAIRCGTGSIRMRRARCRTSGVSARQTMSLIRNAERTPERVMVTASRPSGPVTRFRAQRLRRAKKPDRRRKPTTTIMPNSKARVL